MPDFSWLAMIRAGYIGPCTWHQTTEGDRGVQHRLTSRGHPCDPGQALLPRALRDR